VNRGASAIAHTHRQVVAMVLIKGANDIRGQFSGWRLIDLGLISRNQFNAGAI
jgi:hypothetical protein